MNETSTITDIRRFVIVVLTIAGVLFLILALAADSLGIDITPGFGVIQMVAFLAGVTLLTASTFIYLHGKRPKSAPRSLQAEIATRLIATGLVLAYVTGLSDLIGIGTHVEPQFNRPFVGPIQFGGIAAGLLLIVVGLTLYYTSRGQRESSSLGFLVNDKNNMEQ